VAPRWRHRREIIHHSFDRSKSRHQLVEAVTLRVLHSKINLRLSTMVHHPGPILYAQMFRGHSPMRQLGQGMGLLEFEQSQPASQVAGDRTELEVVGIHRPLPRTGSKPNFVIGLLDTNSGG
ncbi:MAG: hypothetical protein ACK5TN_03035, partial [Acidobacteriota bacterium]